MSIPEVVNAQSNDRTPSLIKELIREIEQFIQTRTDLLKTEILEKLPHLRNAALLAVGGGLLLALGFLFLAIAVVVLIGAAFPPNLYRWFFGFLIVGIISVGFGAIGAFLAKSEFDVKSILPRGTLRVLKGDAEWVSKAVQK